MARPLGSAASCGRSGGRSAKTHRRSLRTKKAKPAPGETWQRDGAAQQAGAAAEGGNGNE